MDQTTFQVQILLGNIPECCKDINILCHYRLLSGCHCGTLFTNQPFNLRNLTNITYPLDKIPINELFTKTNTTKVKK